MKRGLRSLVMMAVVGMLGAVQPAGAATTTIATGKIVTPNAVFSLPSPEEMQYIAGGCAQNVVDGQYSAVISLKAFQGRTIRITYLGSDLRVGVVTPLTRVETFTACSAAASYPLIARGSGRAVSFVATEPYLVLTFDYASPAVIGQGTRYKVVAQ